jgi:uncharacterized protein
MMPFYFDNYNAQDLDVIQKQLDSKEVFICGIYKKCRFGYPQIIFLNPGKKNAGEEIINYEAISNIIWLTCPYLNNNIHELENSSYIKKIKTIIQNNTSFTNRMLRAHADYYYMRDFIFRKYVFSACSVEEQEAGLFRTGIGGMRELSAIKCLHLHYCHYNLCKDNIAGLITLRLLKNKTECNDSYCSCYR